jgi:tetratricopeptide (TPR) repeat protein
VAVDVAGKRILAGAPPLRYWHSEYVSGGKGGGQHWEKTYSGNASTNLLASAARSENGVEQLKVNVYLTSPDELFASQQSRAMLFGLLVIASTVAALIGLFAAWLAFHRQLRLAEMKSNFVSSVPVIMLALATVARGATNDLTGLLQKGLFEEEANRNLDAAISDYQSLANQFDKDRQLAATAIFRLGECYRALGRTNDAVVQYERIVREFSDQQTLVTLSRQNLAGLGHTERPATGQQGSGSPASEQAQELELVKKLQAMPLNEILQVAPTVLTDATLINLIYQYNQTELDLIRLRTDHGEEHSEVKKEDTIRAALADKIKERLEGLSQALSLELGASATTSGAGRAGVQETATTDEEERQIRDIQAMIQNSPDLINAPGTDGKTPLQSAAEKGQLVVAKYLLDHGANVNEPTRNRHPVSTPLCAAAENGHKVMVELLLARGADVNGGGSIRFILRFRRTLTEWRTRSWRTKRTRICRVSAGNEPCTRRQKTATPN